MKPARGMVSTVLLVLGACLLPPSDYSGMRCSLEKPCGVGFLCTPRLEGGGVCAKEGVSCSDTELCNGVDDDCDGLFDEVPNCIVTLAGIGPPAHADGEARLARFAGPQLLTTDAAGNVYVADTYNHEIRKVTPTGTTTTLAGNGHCGKVDGPADKAQFCKPVAVVVTQTGAVFVSDSLNHSIRRIVGGQVTTLAGGTRGFQDGTGDQARFDTPSGIHLLANGNLAVADTLNHRIRRVNTVTGQVTTEAGTGVAGDAEGTKATLELQKPIDVVSDAAGTLYISEQHRIRKVGSSTSTTLAGSLSGALGLVDSATSNAVRFSTPFQLLLNETAGFLLVVDQFNHRIRRVELADGATTTWVGSTRGDVSSSGAQSQLRNPAGLALVDRGASSSTYVFTDLNHRLRKIVQSNSATVLSEVAGGEGPLPSVDGAARGAATLGVMSGLARGADGSLYWVEPESHLLRRRGAGGEVTTLAGVAFEPGFVDGKRDLARLRNPRDVVFGPDGDLYIVDSGNHAIRIFDLDQGTLRTLAGNGTAGFQDGAFSTTRFSNPMALTFVAGTSELWVSDPGNKVVRALNLSTQLSRTCAGTVGQAGLGDGALGTGQLLDMSGTMASDSEGNVFLPDNFGRLVRRISPQGTLTTVFATLPAIVEAVASDPLDRLYAFGSGSIIALNPDNGAATIVHPTPLNPVVLGWQDGTAITGTGWLFRGAVITQEAFYLADSHSRRLRQLWRAP
jgi:hypothetical protein